jgi:hypothetical protein
MESLPAHRTGRHARLLQKYLFRVGAARVTTVTRRGDFSDIEKATIASRSESIVATPAIFIRGGTPVGASTTSNNS